MLTILKKTTDGLRTYERLVEDGWINVIDPTPEEITRLEEWEIPSEMITYPLDLDEMARTERDNGFTFILIRIPQFMGSGVDIPYTTIPLGIIIGDKFVVTICKSDHPILQELASKPSSKITPAKRNRFVLHIFLSTAYRYLNHLRQINKTVEALEDQLQQSTRNREVLDLLKYQKSLVYFTTGLRSNEVMMERLQRSQMFNQYEEDQDLLEDVLTENQQAIQMTNIASNILSSMMDAFASIISNNLNVVMKALATITIVVNMPTIVASFYGMNVNLPFQSHPLAFFITLGISATLVGIAIYIFAKRDWF
ncbi:MAG: magnesium transporter [Anaerolinea sp.]|nr:magnesium transporter [Anaerolinea sp.]